MKIPTKIAGAYSAGEWVELRVRDRVAYVIKPTGRVDPQRRWLWDFTSWLAINDGFGGVAHRYDVEKALTAGFHVAGVDAGPSCGSPAAGSARDSTKRLSRRTVCTLGPGSWRTATAA